MRDYLILAGILLSPFLGFGLAAPCPPASPPAYSSNFNTDDGGAKGCTCDVWDWSGSISANGDGSCAVLSGGTCDIATYTTPLSLSDSWCISFDFLTDAADVSDGVALSLSGGDYSCEGGFGCNEGGNIGYNTINGDNGGAGVLTVEYDVFDNSGDGDDDPACPHVSLVQNSNNNSSLNQGCSPDIGDGAFHSTEICWNAACQEFSVTVDGALTTWYCGDIGSDIFEGTGDNVFVSISSGYNGSFSGQNQICNFNISEMTDVACDFDASCLVLLGVQTNSFVGEAQEKKIKLSWIENENYVVNYILEKSNDGTNFSYLTEIHASSVGDNYIVYDNNPFVGDNYYRIKQIENNGINSYIPKIVVPYAPINNYTIIQYGNEIQITSRNKLNYTIEVYNINGKLLKTSEGTKKKEVFTLNNFTKGIYFVNVKSTVESVSKKVLILND